MIDDPLVFSAPRYCDSTENRGAYINIGPDYKLRYEQFDAVPHPNIRPMVSLPLVPLLLQELALTYKIGLCSKLSDVVPHVRY